MLFYNVLNINFVYCCNLNLLKSMPKIVPGEFNTIEAIKNMTCVWSL